MSLLALALPPPSVKLQPNGFARLSTTWQHTTKLLVLAAWTLPFNLKQTALRMLVMLSMGL